MKKVIVTGASGFIGNRTAKYFVEKGYDVIGWNRSESKESFPVLKVDMQSKEELAYSLRSFYPDIIIHCAGNADVAESVKDPIADFDNNVAVTHKLLFAVHELGLEKTRFIFLSSAGVYGNPKALPITEDMTLNPLSPYAVHKAICEEICKYFVINYEMDVKIARIFSAYGAGLRKQIFWDMFRKYVENGRMEMLGTGNESRDYIHVDDVAQSLFLLANTENKDVIYNIANGEEVTIKEATELFADCMGAGSDCISFNGVVREGDPLNWRADITRMRGLGYKRTVDMESGLGGYIAWVKGVEE